MAEREWMRSLSSPNGTSSNNYPRFASRQLSRSAMLPQAGILPTHSSQNRFERSPSHGIVSSLGRRTMERSRSLRNNFNVMFEELGPFVERVRNGENMDLSSLFRAQQQQQQQQQQRSDRNPEPSTSHTDENSTVIDVEENEYPNVFIDDIESGTVQNTAPSQPPHNQQVPTSSNNSNNNSNNNNNENHTSTNTEDNAADDLRQSPEAAALLFLIGKYLPFVFLILFKSVWDHISTIILFCGFFGLFRFYNDFVKREIAKQSQRSITYLLLGIIHLVVSISFFYYFYKEEKVYLSLVFLSPPSEETRSLGDLLWLVAITDFNLKLITIIFKIFITLLPVRILPTLKRGKWYLLVEVSSQLYRGLAPTQPWLHFLLNSYNGPQAIMGVVLSAFYMVSKANDFMKSVHIWWKAVMKILSNVQLGVSPSKEQLAVCSGQCPICHDEFDSPVMLECNHVFCEACVAKWFDREPTCPLCRAKVTDDPSWRDGSTTYFIQLF